eukprot:scaffold17.g563.t1
MLVEGATLPAGCNLAVQEPPTPAASNAALYSPNTSSTAQTAQCEKKLADGAVEASLCNYTYSYTSGNQVGGYLFTDNVTLAGGQLTALLEVGADTNHSGNCGKGILALGPAASSLPSQLAKRGMTSRTVSWCLATANPGSFVVLGSAAPQGLALQALAMNASGSFYQARVEGAAVGAAPASVEPQWAVVDTGTSALEVPASVAAQLEAQLKASAAGLPGAEYVEAPAAASGASGGMLCVRVSGGSGWVLGDVFLFDRFIQADPDSSTMYISELGGVPFCSSLQQSLAATDAPAPSPAPSSGPAAAPAAAAVTDAAAVLETSSAGAAVGPSWLLAAAAAVALLAP